MGLFSSQKKTVVATQAQRVVKDKDIPDSVKTGILKGIMENGDLPMYMMEELSSSIGYKAERMYEYGARKNGYMFGNPSSTVVSPVKGNQTVENYIERIEGKAVAIQYLHYGPMNLFHYAFKHITEKYGYNVYTNMVSFRPPGLENQAYEVYLDSVVAYVHADTITNNSDSKILEIWGPDPNTGKTPERFYAENMGDTGWKRRPYVETIPDAEAEYMEVNFIWLHKYWDTSAESYQHEYKYYSFKLVGGWDEGNFYQALYSTQDNVYTFWNYLEGSGVTELDNIYLEDDPANAAGSFFPFLYFRYDKKNPLDNKESQEVKQSRKMCKYLGLSYDMVVDAIHENPDAKDVEQAMMMMMVPANTENEMEKRYLFEFFDQLNLQAQLPNPAFTGISNGILFGERNAQRSIIIQDKRFKLSLGFNYMKKTLVSGHGKLGEYTSGTGFDEYTWQTSDKDGAVLTHKEKMRYHWYRYQISHNQCEEIRIGNLRMTYHIWGSYTDVGNDEEEILLVPIDRSITKKYSARHREELYCRSLHFIFNTRQIITLKWYQREWFQLFMVVVVIIITVLTWGAAAAAAMAALQAGTLSLVMALQGALIGILKYLASMVAVKLFIQAVGGEAAMILALVALAFGIKEGGRFIGAAAEGAAAWATTLVDSALSLIKGIGSFYGDEIKKIMEEMNLLGKQYEEDMKLIESAQELLDQQTILSPMVIFGETPDQYFARTTRSGNIGVLSLDFARTYVDQALALPDFATTTSSSLMEA